MKKQVFLCSIAVFIVIVVLFSGCKSINSFEESSKTAKGIIANESDNKSIKNTSLSTESKQEAKQATNIDAVQPISGSLALQSNLALCPHLSMSFECDKYDIRRCTFKRFVGKNNFYPDYMICRAGDTLKYPDENKENQYCFIQECSYITQGNVVNAYGKIIAFAEYQYQVKKQGSGIMTYYTLLSCGEIEKQFANKDDCQFYYADWQKIRFKESN